MQNRQSLHYLAFSKLNLNDLQSITEAYENEARTRTEAQQYLDLFAILVLYDAKKTPNTTEPENIARYRQNFERIKATFYPTKDLETALEFAFLEFYDENKDLSSADLSVILQKHNFTNDERKKFTYALLGTNTEKVAQLVNAGMFNGGVTLSSGLTKGGIKTASESKTKALSIIMAALLTGIFAAVSAGLAFAFLGASPFIVIYIAPVVTSAVMGFVRWGYGALEDKLKAKITDNKKEEIRSKGLSKKFEALTLPKNYELTKAIDDTIALSVKEALVEAKQNIETAMQNGPKDKKQMVRLAAIEKEIKEIETKLNRAPLFDSKPLMPPQQEKVVPQQEQLQKQLQQVLDQVVELQKQQKQLQQVLDQVVELQKLQDQRVQLPQQVCGKSSSKTEIIRVQRERSKTMPTTSGPTM